MKKASDIQNKRADEDSDGYAHFSKSHPLHGRQIQRVYESISDCRVIGFTRKQPLAFAEVENAEEKLVPNPKLAYFSHSIVRYAAIMLALFVPWGTEDQNQLFLASKSFTSLWAEVEKILSP